MSSFRFPPCLLLTLQAALALAAPARATAADAAPEPTRLPTIVVTATRTEKTLDESPVRTEVIDRAEMDRINARSLKEALENVPGLQLQEVHGKSGYQVSLQGLTSDQVLVLVDGLPISASTGSTVDLSQYSLAEVERIEVVKGATSAQYGSSAMGGVINVITRPVASGLVGGAVVDLGSYGAQNVSGDTVDDARRHAQLRVEGGGQTLRARLAGDIVDDEGFTIDPDAWTRQGDAMRRQQLTARVDWLPTAHGAFWLDSNFYREDDVSRYQYYAPPHYVPQRRTDAIDRDRYAAGGKWSWDNGTRFQLKGVDEHYEGHSQEFSNDAVAGDRRTEQRLDHVSAQLDLPLWRRQLWTVGGDFHREALTQSSNGISELETDGDAVRRSHELFVQNDMALGDRWELLLGGRWQRDSDFGDYAVPRLSLRGQLLDSGDWSGTLRLSVGQGYRVPNLKERYYLFDHSSLGYKVIGNPDLDPESSDSYQAGFTLQWRERVTADLNLFRNDVHDLIQTDLDSAQVVNGISYYSYDNVARAMTQGVESSLRWQLTSSLDANASYTLTDTENRSDGGELTRRPRHMARLGGNWTLPTRTTLSLRGRYQSSELVDSASGSRSPAWTVLDLKLNQTLRDGLDLFAGFDNLFDVQRDFADTRDFSPIVGRFIYLGARYQWSLRRSPG